MKKVLLAFGVLFMLGATSCSMEDAMKEGLEKAAEEAKTEMNDAATDADAKSCKDGETSCKEGESSCKEGACKGGDAK